MRFFVVSKEGKCVEFDPKLKDTSHYLKTQVDANEDLSKDLEIPLKDFGVECLSKLFDFLKFHDKYAVPVPEKPLQRRLEDYCVESWDKEYFSELDSDPTLLIEMINACNFLGLHVLLDLCCAKVTSMSRGKTAQQIRATFGIENDLTKEEEDRFNEELAWIDEFDGI